MSTIAPPPVSGALLHPNSKVPELVILRRLGFFGMIEIGDADAMTKATLLWQGFRTTWIFRTQFHVVKSCYINFLVPLSGMKLLWCITNMIISSFQNAEFHTPHVYILQTWRYFQAHLLLVYIIHWYLKTVFFTHHINTWIGPPDFHTPLIGAVPTGPLRPWPANGPSLPQLQLLPPRAAKRQGETQKIHQKILRPQWKGPIPFL